MIELFLELNRNFAYGCVCNIVIEYEFEYNVLSRFETAAVTLY